MSAIGCAYPVLLYTSRHVAPLRDGLSVMSQQQQQQQQQTIGGSVGYSFRHAAAAAAAAVTSQKRDVTNKPQQRYRRY